MDVGALGGGTAGIDPLALRALVRTLAEAPSPLLSAGSALTSATANDSVAPTLRDLATPALQHLLQTVDAVLAQSAPQLAGSTQLTSQPAHVAGYGADAVLPSVRNSALESVAKAAHAFELAGPNIQPPANSPDPRTVIALAYQFIETGQLPNFRRAEELGRVVSGWYGRDVPAGIRAEIAANRRDDRRQLRSRFEMRLKNLWRRAPLLILLTAWLLAGIVPGFFVRLFSLRSDNVTFGFELWATGFLFLVGLQFVATNRSYRR